MSVLKTTKTREELGTIYKEIVGYNIIEDDTDITIPEILNIMREYDMDEDEREPFFNANAYYL